MVHGLQAVLFHSSLQWPDTSWERWVGLRALVPHYIFNFTIHEVLQLSSLFGVQADSPSPKQNPSESLSISCVHQPGWRLM